LGIAPSAGKKDIKCVYCGQPATQLDHFRSLTEKGNLSQKGRPTGYITDIFNLVPCCSTCNSSKANANWRDWMNGSADKSPKRLLSASEFAVRIALLDQFEEWSTPLATRLNVLSIVGAQEWEQYEAEIATVVTLLQAARKHSDRFHTRLKQAYDEAQAIAAERTIGAVGSDGYPTL
jgi:hypothetical protein